METNRIELTEQDLEKVNGGVTEFNDWPDGNEGPFYDVYNCAWCGKQFWYNCGQNKRACYAGWAYHYHQHQKHDPSPFNDDWGLTEAQKTAAKSMFNV